MNAPTLIKNQKIGDILEEYSKSLFCTDYDDVNTLKYDVTCKLMEILNN
jgi:hypothetical protein